MNVFAANLTRGLHALGIPAHVLLTEENTRLIDVVDPPMLRPDDVPMARLPVEHEHSWGAHWGAMIRYLEERAPCIYIPNSDWRHSCVTPQLSDGVAVVGVVHSDDPLHYDHVRRLGSSWNAISATSPTIARRTIEIDSTFTERVSVIPIGVEIPDELPRRSFSNGPLRVLYAGLLKQHQKRVLDLPRIVAAAIRLGVPIELTVAGGGPDEEPLRLASRELVAAGAMRFVGVVDHARMPELMLQHDVFLLTSEFEGMPNAMLEAMASGCVPLVTAIDSAVPDVVAEGRNGHVVAVGDIDAFAARLRRLHDDVDHRRRLSAAGYETVRTGGYDVREMVARYLELFDRVLNDSVNRLVRPPAELVAPPKQVAGVSLFPVDLPFKVRGVGRFCAHTPDFVEFRQQLRELPARCAPRGSLVDAIRDRSHWSSPQAMRRQDDVTSAREPAPPSARLGTAEALAGVEVIVGLTHWTPAGLGSVAHALVRELRERGVAAHLLLTEHDTVLVSAQRPRPSLPNDIPIERLPVSRTASWGAHWGATIRYLTERAPCIWLPNDDWRHSCVVPRLPEAVRVLSVVPANSLPLHLDHLRRIGRYLDAIVAVTPEIAQQVCRQDASLARRLYVYPLWGAPEDLVSEYLGLFAGMLDTAREDRFRRTPGELDHPPHAVAGVSLFPVEYGFAVQGVGRFLTENPDYDDFCRELHGVASVSRRGRRLLSRIGRWLSSEFLAV